MYGFIITIDIYCGIKTISPPKSYPTACKSHKMNNLIEQYNYDSFVPEKFEQWLNFKNSPLLGQSAPDFDLWNLDESPTGLSAIWSQHQFTVVEFGSFT